MQNRNSKRKNKIIKPFLNNQRLYDRLQRYVGEQEASRLKQSSSPDSTKRNQPANRVAEEKKSSSDSDSDISDYYYEDRAKAENYANTSLRNIYLKSDNATPEVSKASRVEGNFESPNFGDVSTNVPNDLDNDLPQTPISTVSSKRCKKSKSKLENENQLESSNPSTALPLQHSTVMFSDVGGLNNTLHEICMLLLHLKHPTIYKKIGVKNPPRGFLLHGPPGCGKTLIAHAIAGELALPFVKVAATELVSGISGESESKIRELFDGAVSNAPCILFIDEIDAITPKRDTVQREMEKRIVTQLLKCMDELSMKDADTQVMVIGATNRPHALDPALRRAGRFDREISIGIPDETARLQILKIVCSDLRLVADFNLEWLARHTPGYVGADLMAITREAANNAVSRALQTLIKEQLTAEEKSEVSLASAVSWLKDKPPLTDEQLENFYVETADFQDALNVYVPSAKREGFATIPSITWKEVGALKDVQDALQKFILWPVKYRKEFKEFHLSAPTGVLLCGPKGCGKTLLAKAIANECSINFLSVKGPELLSMYVGESEKAVRECFQRARNSAPCVIFFDEIDALCPVRSSTHENAAAERVVNQLLTEIDGIEGRKQIFVLGATNRPENIDSAMLRPGRLEKIIYIGVPNQTDRLDILRTITHDGTKPKLGIDIDLENVSGDPRCEGFSGADLDSFVREASMKAFEEHILAGDTDQKTEFEIHASHCEYAFSVVKPSNSKVDKKHFKGMNLFPPPPTKKLCSGLGQSDVDGNSSSDKTSI